MWGHWDVGQGKQRGGAEGVVPQEPVAAKGQGMRPHNCVGLREQHLHEVLEAPGVPHSKTLADEVDVDTTAVPLNDRACRSARVHHHAP